MWRVPPVRHATCHQTPCRMQPCSTPGADCIQVPCSIRMKHPQTLTALGPVLRTTLLRFQTAPHTCTKVTSCSPATSASFCLSSFRFSLLSLLRSSNTVAVLASRLVPPWQDSPAADPLQLDLHDLLRRVIPACNMRPSPAQTRESVLLLQDCLVKHNQLSTLGQLILIMKETMSNKSHPEVPGRLRGPACNRLMRRKAT